MCFIFWQVIKSTSACTEEARKSAISKCMAARFPHASRRKSAIFSSALSGNSHCVNWDYSGFLPDWKVNFFENSTLLIYTPTQKEGKRSTAKNMILLFSRKTAGENGKSRTWG